MNIVFWRNKKQQISIHLKDLKKDSCDFDSDAHIFLRKSDSCHILLFHSNISCFFLFIFVSSTLSIYSHLKFKALIIIIVYWLIVRDNDLLVQLLHSYHSSINSIAILSTINMISLLNFFQFKWKEPKVKLKLILINRLFDCRKK